MESLFNEYISPVMDSKKGIFDKQKKEAVSKATTAAFNITPFAVGTTGAAALSVQDAQLRVLRDAAKGKYAVPADIFIKEVSVNIEGNSALKTKAIELADNIREEYIRREGREKYDAVSAKVGGDFASVYVENSFHQLIINKLIEYKTPKSTIDYISRDIISGSMLGRLMGDSRSDLDKAIDKAAMERKYDSMSRGQAAVSWITTTIGGIGVDIIDNPLNVAPYVRGLYVAADLAMTAHDMYKDSKEEHLSYTPLSNPFEISKAVLGETIETSLVKDLSRNEELRNHFGGEQVNLETILERAKTDQTVMTAMFADKAFRTRCEKEYAPYFEKHGIYFNKNVDAGVVIVTGENKVKVSGVAKAYVFDNANAESLGFAQINKVESKETTDYVATEIAEEHVGNTAIYETNSELSQQLTSSHSTDPESPSDESSNLSQWGSNLGSGLASAPDAIMKFLNSGMSMNMSKGILPLGALLLAFLAKSPLLKMLLLILGGVGFWQAAKNDQSESQVQSEDRSQRSLSQPQYKQYPDEKLNSRISDVRISGTTVVMTIDNIPRTVNITSQAAAACHAGAVPLNTLANRILQSYDVQQQNISQNISTAHDQEMGHSRGL